MISRICGFFLLCWPSLLLGDPIGFTSLATASAGFAFNDYGCTAEESDSGPNEAGATTFCAPGGAFGGGYNRIRPGAGKCRIWLLEYIRYDIRWVR
jgi:hypothetical protein